MTDWLEEQKAKRREEIGSCSHEWNNFLSGIQRCVLCKAQRTYSYRDLNRTHKNRLKELQASLKTLKKEIAEVKGLGVEPRLKRKSLERQKRRVLADITFLRGYKTY